MNRREIQRNVARGVRLLDAKDPGWWKNGTTPHGIDIAALDMRHGNVCVLGQRNNGMYNASARRLGLPLLNDQFRYGFNVNPRFLMEENNEFWSYLAELWIAVITVRRYPRRKASAWAASLRKEHPLHP